jgi:hypothetical protein
MHKTPILLSTITSGNASEDGCKNDGRGWFIGSFIDPAQGLRHSDDIEVKWGRHRARDERVVPGISDTSTTLTLLISGHFVVDFPNLLLTMTLRKPGDYVIFASRVAHTWKVIEDSVVVTVRWPSTARSEDQ